MDGQNYFCFRTLTRCTLLHSHNKVTSIHETGMCFGKEQELHISCVCICLGNGDKVIGPLFINGAKNIGHRS